MKVIYCCTQNVGNLIISHNKKLINSSTLHVQPWNCRKKEVRPLERKCRTENINYKSIVPTSGLPDKAYCGTAEKDFKKRYYNHYNHFLHKWDKNEQNHHGKICLGT